jgi:hypothetical protein
LKYNYTLVLNGKDVHSLLINAVLHHSLVSGFRFIAKSGAFGATRSAEPFFAIPPLDGVANILTGSYDSPRFAGISLGLEKYLAAFSFGMVSVSAAYQAVYSHGDLRAHQFDHGAAALPHLYFSGPALPAIGLSGAYNVTKNVWQYTFNRGMSF